MYDIGLPQVVHLLCEQQLCEQRGSIQNDYYTFKRYTFKRYTFKRYPGHILMQNMMDSSSNWYMITIRLYDCRSLR